MTLTERLGGREAITTGVVDTFRALSAFPHASHHEGALGDWLMDTLEARGLHPVRDEMGNLMADVPATPGREGAPRLILQGHLDMVCAATEDFDPLRDPVVVAVRDGMLCTDGRSCLGADNNLGNAAVLWLLDKGLRHGPLRLLFTVAEEVGLQGAQQVSPQWLEGCSYLLNTDGFHLGRAVIGSAGGRRETYSRPLETEAGPGGNAWRLSITGGAGGHSGDDIHKGRANAVQLMAQLLDSLRCPVAEFTGGTAHNAIAGSATAVVCCDSVEIEMFQQLLQEEFETLDEKLTLSCVPEETPALVWTEDFRQAALGLLCVLFHGVYALHHSMPKVVGASANLGQVWVQDGNLQIGCFVRSARAQEGERLATLHDSAAARYGFAPQVTSYPAWPGDGDSPLVDLMDKIYRRETGHWMEVTAVHVGLEPSVFYAKCPGLIMASTGPDIFDAHSPEERAPLEHLPDFVLLLAGIAEGL